MNRTVTNEESAAPGSRVGWIIIQQILVILQYICGVNMTFMEYHYRSTAVDVIDVLSEGIENEFTVTGSECSDILNEDYVTKHRKYKRMDGY